MTIKVQTNFQYVIFKKFPEIDMIGLFFLMRQTPHAVIVLSIHFLLEYDCHLTESS